MPNQPARHLLLSLLALVTLSCDPITYVTQEHYFSDKYTLTEVTAPQYPFNGTKMQNPISIEFPKQGEYLLSLSDNQCGGEYEANTDGELKFTRSNCTSDCCESEWDHYVLTLLNKTTRFKSGKHKPLILMIDDDNYLVLEILPPVK